MSKDLTIPCAVCPKDSINVTQQRVVDYLYINICWERETPRSVCLSREDAARLAQHILKMLE